MPKSLQRIIILARMEHTKRRLSGKMGIFSQPHAVYWSRREQKGDLKNAQRVARAEGYEVMVYPEGTERPLHKAKTRIQELHGG